ncbi:MAG TPA: hypothetical protein QGH18_04945, partial [Arenicellales bacterium]|nr:hypothetical protein [Arenicellales bacterium]
LVLVKYGQAELSHQWRLDDPHQKSPQQKNSRYQRSQSTQYQYLAIVLASPGKKVFQEKSRRVQQTLARPAGVFPVKSGVVMALLRKELTGA